MDGLKDGKGNIKFCDFGLESRYFIQPQLIAALLLLLS
jgi:hypothetical protein